MHNIKTTIYAHYAPDILFRPPGAQNMNKTLHDTKCDIS